MYHQILDSYYFKNCVTDEDVDLMPANIEFGPVIVLHKGNDDVECLTESEICGAVIFHMDSEVTLCYDGREFTAFELF